MDTIHYEISHDTVVRLTSILAPDPDGPLVPLEANISLLVPHSNQRVTVKGRFVSPGIVGGAVGYCFILENGETLNALEIDCEWISRSPERKEAE